MAATPPSPAQGIQPAFKRVQQSDDFDCWAACIVGVVQPDSKIVMVVMRATQTQNETVDQFKDNLSFWHGILKSVGGSTGMYPWIH